MLPPYYPRSPDLATTQFERRWQAWYPTTSAALSSGSPASGALTPSKALPTTSTHMVPFNLNCPARGNHYGFLQGPEPYYYCATPGRHPSHDSDVSSLGADSESEADSEDCPDSERPVLVSAGKSRLRAGAPEFVPRRVRPPSPQGICSQRSSPMPVSYVQLRAFPRYRPSQCVSGTCHRLTASASGMTLTMTADSTCFKLLVFASLETCRNCDV